MLVPCVEMNVVRVVVVRSTIGVVVPSLPTVDVFTLTDVEMLRLPPARAGVTGTV